VRRLIFPELERGWPQQQMPRPFFRCALFQPAIIRGIADRQRQFPVLLADA
jgi:hypothetical protein